MKRILFYLLAALPFALYFLNLIPSLVADELPDSAFITPFNFEGKNYYNVFAKYERTSEDAQGRTSHSISEKVIILDPETHKIIHSQTLTGNIKKLSNGYLWDIDSDNGLFLCNPLNGEIAYTEKDLAKLFPNLKERGSYYSYKDSIWTIKYKDGSEESFNENKIPKLQVKTFNTSETDYKNKWSTSRSSGERAFIVYNNITSKNDLLNPEFINDSYTRKLITTDGGTKCMILFQKEMNGKSFYGLTDSLANIVWERPAADFGDASGSSYTVKDKNDKIISFRMNRADCFDLSNGNEVWKASFGGEGLIPNWLFWTLAITWAIIFAYLAEPKTAKTHEESKKDFISNRSGKKMNT